MAQPGGHSCPRIMKVMRGRSTPISRLFIAAGPLPGRAGRRGVRSVKEPSLELTPLPRGLRARCLSPGSPARPHQAAAAERGMGQLLWTSSCLAVPGLPRPPAGSHRQARTSAVTCQRPAIRAGPSPESRLVTPTLLISQRPGRGHPAVMWPQPLPEAAPTEHRNIQLNWRVKGRAQVLAVKPQSTSGRGPSHSGARRRPGGRCAGWPDWRLRSAAGSETRGGLGPPILSRGESLVLAAASLRNRRAGRSVRGNGPTHKTPELPDLRRRRVLPTGCRLSRR